MKEFGPNIVAFCCERCGCAPADYGGHRDARPIKTRVQAFCEGIEAR